MSSDSSTVEILMMNNYTALGIVTAVTYDYLLIFSREMQFVWRQPWTWVSAMYVLVRYVGLVWAIFSALSSTTFITGPEKVGAGITFLNQWAFAIFLNAADAVMIVRVYAMWNQSKWILYLLLFVYVPQVIISIIFTAVFNTTKYLTVTIAQVLDFSSCNPDWINVPYELKVDQVIPRFILGALLLIFAVAQTLRQSIRMYMEKKEWQPNRYVEQFVKDGVFYFFVNVVLNITSILEGVDGITLTLSNTALQFLTMFYVATFCAIMPRFFISMRELYDRDSRGWKADAKSGELSQQAASRGAVVSAIAFAGVAPGQDSALDGENGSEEIQLEPLGNNAHGV